MTTIARKQKKKETRPLEQEGIRKTRTLITRGRKKYYHHMIPISWAKFSPFLENLKGVEREGGGGEL